MALCSGNVWWFYCHTVYRWCSGSLKSTSGASPDSAGTTPVRVAANSRVTPPTTNFFIGDIDEVRAWNDDLTATEQANAFAGTSFNTGEQVLYLDFSGGGGGGGYNYAPSFTATGSNYFDVASLSFFGALII